MSRALTPLFFDLNDVKSMDGEEAQVPLYVAPIVLPETVKLETNEQLLSHEPVVEQKPVETPSQLLTWRADPFELPPEAEQEAQANAPLWMALFMGIAVLFVAILLVDTWAFLVARFSHSVVMGGFFSLLIIGIVGVASVLSWRSWQKLRQFREVSQLQREGLRLMQRDAYGQARPYVNRIAQIYAQRSDVKRRLDTFQRSVHDRHQDREVCALFSQQVMQDLDQQAYRLVVQRSQEAALLATLSPIPLLDALLTLWRNIRLIQDLATLYAGRPGLFGSMALSVSVFQTIIYAGVSEVIADGLAESLGNSFLAVLSTQAAQGMSVGILTARVGLKTIHACRPLPFAEEERPRLREIRRELICSFKRLFENRKEAH
jgi:putative membrane protein